MIRLAWLLVMTACGWFCFLYVANGDYDVYMRVDCACQIALETVNNQNVRYLSNRSLSVMLLTLTSEQESIAKVFCS